MTVVHNAGSGRFGVVDGAHRVAAYRAMAAEDPKRFPLDKNLNAFVMMATTPPYILVSLSAGTLHVFFVASLVSPRRLQNELPIYFWMGTCFIYPWDK